MLAANHHRQANSAACLGSTPTGAFPRTFAPSHLRGCRKDSQTRPRTRPGWQAGEREGADSGGPHAGPGPLGVRGARSRRSGLGSQQSTRAWPAENFPCPSSETGSPVPGLSPRGASPQPIIPAGLLEDEGAWGTGWDGKNRKKGGHVFWGGSWQCRARGAACNAGVGPQPKTCARPWAPPGPGSEDLRKGVAWLA